MLLRLLRQHRARHKPYVLYTLLCAVFHPVLMKLLHPVTAYSDDPQSRLGLTRCMEALKRMEITWPSAGRALELLRGSKVYAADARATPNPSDRDRHKRTAEQPLDAEDVLKREYQVQPSLYSVQERDRGTESSFFQLNPPVPSVSAQSAHSTAYDNWADASMSSYFPGTISTSVHLQMYSTGLVDERGDAFPANERTSSSFTGGYGHGQTGRPSYPQYWNDYTSATLPQLGYVPALPENGYAAAAVQSATATRGPSNVERYGVYGSTVR
jgi:hypothetical protein